MIRDHLDHVTSNESISESTLDKDSLAHLIYHYPSDLKDH